MTMSNMNVNAKPIIEIRQYRNAGPRAVWEDRFGAQCSMQECKSTVGQYIWIGPDGQRMCLDQETVAELWPLLKRFAEVGTLTDQPVPQPSPQGRMDPEPARAPAAVSSLPLESE